VIRATRNRAEPTDLMHFGMDLHGAGGCADPASALTTMEGFAMPSPQRTLDVVLGGRIFRVERRSVALAVGARVTGKRVPSLEGIQPVAEVRAGAEAMSANGRGTGFLLGDNRLFPFGSPEVAAANSSRVIEVTPQTWDTFARGPALAVSR
jgi:hypothetical protein